MRIMDTGVNRRTTQLPLSGYRASRDNVFTATGNGPELVPPRLGRAYLHGSEVVTRGTVSSQHTRRGGAQPDAIIAIDIDQFEAARALTQHNAPFGRKIPAPGELAAAIQKLELRRFDVIDALSFGVGRFLIKTIRPVESQPSGGGQIDRVAAGVLNCPRACRRAIHVHLDAVRVRQVRPPRGG